MIPRREHVKAGPDASFPTHRTRRHGFPFIWHWHPEYELTLILRGRGERYVGDHIEPFTEGDLVLIGGNLPHSWSATVRRQRWCEAVVVQFDPMRMGTSLWALPEMQPVMRTLECSSRGLVFDDDAVRDVLAGLPALRASGRLVRLLDVLTRLADLEPRPLCSPGYRVGPSRRDQERLENVLATLHTDFRDEVSVGPVAQMLGLTPEATCRFFKRSTGRTLIQYVHALRVAEACRLLGETDDNISDIAFEVGFGNLPHFNRVFRRERGMTPRAYRKAVPS